MNTIFLEKVKTYRTSYTIRQLTQEFLYFRRLKIIF